MSSGDEIKSTAIITGKSASLVAALTTALGGAAAVTPNLPPIPFFSGGRKLRQYKAFGPPVLSARRLERLKKQTGR